MQNRISGHLSDEDACIAIAEAAEKAYRQAKVNATEGAVSKRVAVGSERWKVTVERE